MDEHIPKTTRLKNIPLAGCCKDLVPQWEGVRMKYGESVGTSANGTLPLTAQSKSIGVQALGKCSSRAVGIKEKSRNGKEDFTFLKVTRMICFLAYYLNKCLQKWKQIYSIKEMFLRDTDLNSIFPLCFEKMCLFISYVYKCFACTHIYIQCACLVPTEVRRGYPILRNWNYRLLRTTVWVLEIGLGSIGRAASALNC